MIRRQHLNKYNKLIKAGFEKSDAAAEVGYSLRAFQLWNRKLNKKWSNQKHKQKRISHIHHIEGDLRCFIKKEWMEGRYPVKNSLVMEKTKDMCGDFKSKNPNAQRNIIKKFMQRAKEMLPPPPRNKMAAPIKSKVGVCKGDNCVDKCCRKTNCPHKRMISKTFKKNQKVKHGKKGNGLVILKDCKKGDFIIEYFGIQADAKVLREDGGKHPYYMRLDNMTINCDIKNTPAKFINHSCDPNCVLEIKDHEGTPHACVVAKKMICSGLELTIHYNWERKQDDPFTECLCGSRKCDGKIEKLGK